MADWGYNERIVACGEVRSVVISNQQCDAKHFETFVAARSVTLQHRLYYCYIRLSPRSIRKTA
jgi:hypothetical protein